MKQDECDFLLGKPIQMHPKREKYLKSKWLRRGWEGKKLEEMRHYVANVNNIMPTLDGQVVVLAWKGWLPESVGIVEDHNDNGWHFFTTGTLKHNTSWFLGDYEFNEIAYVMPHPHPVKIWEKMNLLFWKYHKREDRFHQKITEMSDDTHLAFGDVVDGKQQFVYFNPNGKIGECRNYCQCKKL